MPDNNLTKPSLAMLPMDDIVNYIRHIANFSLITDNSPDTDNVAGEPAENIAIAVSPLDRTTVLNSLNLGGVPASEYLSKQNGGNAIIDTNVNQSKEICDIRDELYQLKSELSKKGVVCNHDTYSGFYDNFNSSDILYEKDFISKAIQDSNTNEEIFIPFEDLKLFDEGDYICIYSKNYDRYHVAQITDIDTVNEKLIFTPAAAFSINLNNEIYKSHGEYIDGTFQFSKRATLIPGPREYHTGVDDDTFKIRKTISVSNTGLGFTFRLNSFAKGFLTKLTIQARAYGTPGSLMCYIINQDDIDLFLNPEQAQTDGLILAKSQPLSIDANYGERLWDFDFYDGTTYPLLNKEDEPNKIIRYCAIIEVLSADTSNYVSLLLLKPDSNKYPVTSLQLNNITYAYSKKANSSTLPALVTNDTINEDDVFYNITTNEVIDDSFIPFREGIYTAKKYLPEPITITNARLMLRIGREGYYNIDASKNNSYGDYSFIPVVKDPVLGIDYDMLQLGGFGFNSAKEDKCIIGSFIREPNGFNTSSIELKKGIYLEEDNMPIYRAAYKVYLKAQLKEYDPNTNTYVYSNKKKIELPLECVFKDRKKKNKSISDRLIYENYFVDENDKNLLYNDFELQIYWRTEYAGVYEEEKYKQDFVGKIHDLVLSFGRTN